MILTSLRRDETLFLELPSSSCEQKAGHSLRGGPKEPCRGQSGEMYRSLSGSVQVLRFYPTLTSESQFHGFWQKSLVQVVRDEIFSLTAQQGVCALCLPLGCPQGSWRVHAVGQVDTAHAGRSCYRRPALRKPQSFIRGLPASLPSLCPAGEHYLYYLGWGASLPSACRELPSLSAGVICCLTILKRMVVVVSKSWSTLCDPKDCSTPGLLAPHCLLEFAQVHCPLSQ